MPTPERDIKIPVSGIDLSRSLRVNRDGKWARARNAWAPERNEFANRPGSIWFTDDVLLDPDRADDGNNDVPGGGPDRAPGGGGGGGGGGTSAHYPGGTKFPEKPTWDSANTYNDVDSDDADPLFVTVTANAVFSGLADNVKVEPRRINGLAYIPTPRLGPVAEQEFLVGSMVFQDSYIDGTVIITSPQAGGDGQEGARDAIFYVRPDDADGSRYIRLIRHDANMITSVGARMKFLPATFYSESDDYSKTSIVSIYGMGTNGTDPVIGLSKRTLPDSTVGLHAFRLQIYKSQADVDTGYNKAGLISKVRDLGIYKNQVVYGGYHRSAIGAEADPEHFPHFVAFGDPGRPWIIGVNSAIQVGEGVFEPVTAVANTSIPTDTQGNIGQLVCFTPDKMVAYNGFPPTSDDQGAGQFAESGRGVGTWAPNSLARTPAGLVYLGVDGVVYLVVEGSLEGSVPIGRAIEPELKNLTPQQMAESAGVYVDGWYMLSVSDGRTDYNCLQYWADLRSIGRGYDRGVQWFGPMEGQFISSFALARFQNKPRELFAGSGTDGKIYKCLQEDKRSDPRARTQSGDDPRIYSMRLEGPPVDAGNAHRDKEWVRVSAGIGTDKATSVTMDLQQHSNNICDGKGEQFTTSVTPCAAVFGTATFDSAYFSGDGEGFRLIENYPSDRFVGRVARVVIEDSPTVEAKIRVSDVEMAAIPIRRRPTG